MQFSSAPVDQSRRKQFLLGLSGGLLAVAIGGGAFSWFENRSQGATYGRTVSPSAPLVPPRPASSVSPSPTRKLTETEIASMAKPSVVIVENLDEASKKAGEGSGYLYSGDGIVVTDYHVIRGAASLAVRVPSKGVMHVDQVLAYSPESDLAAVQLPEAVTASLETGDDSAVKTGDRVIAISAPLGLAPSLRAGVVGAVFQVAGIRIIQTTAGIDPGMAGGPLFNEYGKVVGLTAAKIGGAVNFNWAVSSREIAGLIAQKRPISLSQMLEETRVSHQVLSNTVSVPARGSVPVPLVVDSDHALLEGAYQVHGGANDIRVSLVTPSKKVLVDSGVVRESGKFSQPLKKGHYLLVFDNRFSMFAAKSISPDLKLSYYK